MAKPTADREQDLSLARAIAVAERETTAGALSCATQQGTLELPGKEFWLRVLDLLFVGGYVVGWSLTASFHPELLEDNPILRAFKANTICVGLDSGPARLAANVLWGLMLVPSAMFALTSYLHLLSYDADKRAVRLQLSIFTVGWVCGVCLVLTFGSQPRKDDPLSVYVHAWGFVLGLFGYALLRLAEVICVVDQFPPPWTYRQQSYMGLLLLFFLWAVAGVAPLAWSLMFHDLRAELLAAPLEHHAFSTRSIATWSWTVGVFVLPIAAHRFLPARRSKLYVSAFVPMVYAPILPHPFEVAIGGRDADADAEP